MSVERRAGSLSSRAEREQSKQKCTTAGQRPLGRRLAFSVVNDRLAGRLRIAVPELFRSSDVARELEERLRKIEFLRSVNVSALTGRALLMFDESAGHAAVLERVAAVLAPSHTLKTDAKATEPKPVSLAASRSSAPSRSSRARGAGASARKTLTVTVAAGVKRGPARPRHAGEESAAWHAMTSEAVIAALATDARHGLRYAEALRRLKSYGPNRTPGRPPANQLVALARQFTSLPVALLIGASAVSIFTGGIADAVVTLAVIGLNAAIGYGTESGSERIIRTMTERRPFVVPVLRGGEEKHLDYGQIVPGDVLVLRPSTIIAADARVIDGDGLQVNEALLTGESEPVEKSAPRVCSLGEALPDRSNMVHTGSFVVGGTGRAVVVATGSKTETGRIEAAALGVETPRTPLERDLEDLGGKLAFVSLIACGAFFGVGYLRGRPFFGMLKSSIALAVAAVPEGLPATATTTLALGLRELRRKGVIIRRLEAVEGLGSLQVLCLDKTGTLTENRMRVDQLHLGTDGVVMAHDAVPETYAVALSRLLEIGTLCSEVALEETPQGLRPVGTPTETAFVTRALERGLDPVSLRAKWPLERLQYRTETERYMVSFHKGQSSSQVLLAVKGDPQQVLTKCSRVMRPDGTVSSIGDALRHQIMRTSDDLAGRGLRVLGFAYGEGSQEVLADKALVWVGAAGLKDPVVPGAKALVERLHRAGIRPIMITGDQAATAQAIATEIGLSPDGALNVLDSTALDRLRPDVLSAIASRTHVFARVPPTKKLRIVEALQQSGLTVGMTGDGFNDAPALKAANVAIAVGRDTATAARDVADVIVSENNLEVIADGVEQGRTVLSNIRKSVHYMVSTNLSEILVLLAESMKQDDLLESPMELLWLNLVTDILPGLGLALEPPERLVMSRSPRNPNLSLLTVGDLRHAAIESAVIAAAVLGAHGYGLATYGPGPQTRGVTFMSLVVSQLLHALACRYDRFEPLGGRALFGNPALNAALLGSAVLQALPVVSPGLRALLGIAPMRLADLAVAGFAGLGSFLANEAILASRSSRSTNLS